MPDAVVVRDLRLDELDAALALNQAAVPHVGEVSRERMRQVLAWADVALAVDVDGALAGFLIAMGPLSGYDSPNYRWFAERYDEDFLYLDRVVVRPEARSLGAGRALYEAAFEARPSPYLVAEVNVEPPNPGSLAFHERLGFEQVGQVEHGPGRVVAMLAKVCEVPEPADELS